MFGRITHVKVLWRDAKGKLWEDTCPDTVTARELNLRIREQKGEVIENRIYRRPYMDFQKQP